MKTTNWTSEDIADQKGLNVIITGAISGLGLETARVLSKKGATIIMAVRSIEKGKVAIAKIKSENPVKFSAKSYDISLAKKLWEVSENLTDIHYDF